MLYVRKHCRTAVNNNVNVDLKKCNLLYKNNNKAQDIEFLSVTDINTRDLSE